MATNETVPFPRALNDGTYPLPNRFCATVAPPMDRPASAGAEKLTKAKKSVMEEAADTMVTELAEGKYQGEVALDCGRSGFVILQSLPDSLYGSGCRLSPRVNAHNADVPARPTDLRRPAAYRSSCEVGFECSQPHV